MDYRAIGLRELLELLVDALFLGVRPIYNIRLAFHYQGLCLGQILNLELIIHLQSLIVH